MPYSSRSLLAILLFTLISVAGSWCVAQEAGLVPAEKDDDSATDETVPLVLLSPQNASGDPQLDHWSEGLRWLLERSLSEVGGVRLLPESAVQFVQKKLEIPPESIPSSMEEGALRRIGEWLEARFIIAGSYRREEERWTARMRLLPVAVEGEERIVEATGGEPMELGERLVDEILAALSIKPSAEEVERLERRPTTSSEALDLFVRGRALGRSSNFSEAAESFLAATALDARFVLADVYLARVLLKQKEPVSAAVILRRALDHEPRDVRGLATLASVMVAQRNVSEAKKVLEAAREAKADDLEVLGLLGQVYIFTSQLEAATEVFETIARLDPTSTASRTQLGRLYLSLKRGDEALQVIEEALRIDPRSPQALIVSAQVHQALNDVPSAIDRLERLADVVRASNASDDVIGNVRQQIERLTQSLAPRFLRAEKPRSYSSEQLAAELRRRLEEAELALVVNPLEGDEAMSDWARELTKDATSDLEKARAIFEGLTRRIQTETGGRARTAKEVFAAWNDPDELFNCQEYAKLYIAVARSVGLESYYVHLERDYRGDVVLHDCASVFVDDRALLVDPAYRWFGVRHVSFQLLEDLQVVAHQLFQTPLMSGGVEQCRIGVKLDPDSAWGRVRLAMALESAGEPQAALEALDEADRLESGRWDTLKIRGRIAQDDGRNQEAEDLFRRALAIHPKDAHLHLYHANSLVQLDRWIEARRHLQRALDLGLPQSDEAKARRATALVDYYLGQVGAPSAGKSVTTEEREKEPRELGAHSDFSRIEIVGAETYDSVTIIRALQNIQVFHLAQLHPRAPLDKALRLLEKEVEKGLQAGGFPRPSTEAAIDDARQKIRIRVEEGTRVRAGPVTVSGNEAIAAEAIVARLVERRESSDGDELLEPFWDLEGHALFGDEQLEKAAWLVTTLYGENGYRDARIEAAVSESSDGEAALEIRVLEEGRQYHVGDVTFLGDFTDDPAEISRKLGLAQGDIAASELDERILDDLRDLGRYYEVRTREIPGTRPGEVDLEAYLVQAEFAPDLSRPEPELMAALRKAARWLLEPEEWDVDHEIVLRRAGDVPSIYGLLDAWAEMRLVLGRQGFSIGLHGVWGEDELPLFIFAIRDGDGFAAIPPLGLRSRFPVGVELVLRLHLRALPPGENRWQLHLGFSVKPAEKAAVRLQLEIAPLGITRLATQDLEAEKDADGFRVEFVRDGQRFRLGTIDAETGAVTFDAQHKALELPFSARSRPDVLDQVVEQATRHPGGGTYRSVAPWQLVATTWSRLEPKIAPSIAADDRALAQGLGLLLREFFGEDGGAASMWGRIAGSPFWKRPVAAGKEVFSIPFPREILEQWKQQPAAYFGSLVLGVFVPLFPADSWPRTLLVEAVSIVTGQSQYTERELVRLLDSTEIGPVGYWALAETAAFGGMNVFARRFAERALAVCTVEGFHRDVALLGVTVPGLLHGVGQELKEADEDEIQAALEGPVTQQEGPGLRELKELCEGRASREPRELGEGLLDFLWRRRLQRWIFHRLSTRWPEIVPEVPPAQP